MKLKWIILIGDENFDLNTIKDVEHDNCTACYDVEKIKNRYCVEFDKDYIFYDYITDTDEFAEVLNQIPFRNPHFVMMTYKDEKRVLHILGQENFPKNIYVDNDYGRIGPVSDFVNQGAIYADLTV